MQEVLSCCCIDEYNYTTVVVGDFTRRATVFVSNLTISGKYAEHVVLHRRNYSIPNDNSFSDYIFLSPPL